MTMIEIAKAHLDNAINFANSDLRIFIEQMVAKDISYFTDVKTSEINEYLQESGWVFHGQYKESKREAVPFFVPFGKNQECYFENGILTYYVGKVFDIDDDIKCLQAEYESEIEREKEYQEQIEYSRKYWENKLSKISRDELIEILVEFDMRDYE